MKFEDEVSLGIEAFKAIEAIIAAVKSAKAGKTSPQQARKGFADLQLALGGDDAAADAAALAKP